MLDVSPDQGTFTRCIRLVIADRQPIVLQGLKSVFVAQRDFEIVGSCSTGTSCLEAIRNLSPDVALLANTLPDLTISEILAIAKAENLSTRLVFFTESESDDDLTAAIAAGTYGTISKYANPDTMLRSLRLMTARISASPEQSQDLSPNGNKVDGAKIEKTLGVLTHRERQIVQLVCDGLSNKEIARQLNVSRGTVKVHLHNIFQKLEISNRTVLATIASLQRSAGFGTLALAALVFAILSDAKASDTNDTDDDSTAYKDLEHSIFEPWKKAILRHIVVVDPGENVLLTQRGSPIKVSQVTPSAAGMEELHATQQAVLSSLGRGYFPTGSSTPYFSPLQQPTNNSQTGSPTTQHQFPPLKFAPNSIRSHGGYGMTAAGVWIDALDNSKAAMQALDPSETPIDTLTVAAMNGTTQVATINIHGADPDPNDFDNPARGPVVHDSDPSLAFGTPSHDNVTSEGNAGLISYGGAGDDTLNSTGLVEFIHGGSGNDTIKGNGGDDAIPGGSGSDTVNGNNGNDSIISAYGGDQLTGSKGNDIFVYSSAIDSNSTQINLAAFGALAFLHMTSTSTSVPPHTLAWIYNPTSNETIIYVNPTDRSLDIGDSDLLEIHLEGVASVAESDFVYDPEAATVAAALEGIDPALLIAIASDGTVLTTGSAHASIEAEASDSTLGTAGVWTMPADDGLRFHFDQDRIGSNLSSRLTSLGEDRAYAAEGSDDVAVTVPAHASSINSQATVLTQENSTFTKEPVQANTGVVMTGHGKAHSTAGLELFEFGMQSAAIVAPVAVAEHLETSDAPGNSGGHGNSQHADKSASAKASTGTELTEPDAPPGHGSSQHADKLASAKASTANELTEPDVTPGHGNSHPSHSASASAMGEAELVEIGAPPRNGGGLDNSPQASQSAVADPTGPDLATGKSGGNSNWQQASHSAASNVSAAALPVEFASRTGGADHEPAFHFKNQGAPSTPIEAVELEQLNDWPVLLGHPGDLAAIPQVGPAAMEDHAASHVNNGQHHAIGHLPHELLI